MLKVIKVTVIMKEEKRRDKSSGESGVGGSNALHTRTYPQTPLNSTLFTQDMTLNSTKVGLFKKRKCNYDNSITTFTLLSTITTIT